MAQISVEDVSIEREVFKGRRYRLHAAKMSGKIIAMKVYEGNRAYEVGFTITNHIFILTVLLKRCSAAARFNQKLMYGVGLKLYSTMNSH
jgi:hypothetical protein